MLGLVIFLVLYASYILGVLVCTATLVQYRTELGTDNEDKDVRKVCSFDTDRSLSFNPIIR